MPRTGILADKVYLIEFCKMDKSSIWSLSLGRWFGIELRLHAFFLLFAVMSIYISTQGAVTDPTLLNYCLASLGILAVSVFLHEIAHTYAAMQFGGHVETILIGPLGGLQAPEVPGEPSYHFITAAAGPFVNFSIMVLAGCMIAFNNEPIMGLLSPLPPKDVFQGTQWMIGLKLTFWINWVLFLVNLLPAYPLDGAPALRSLLWPLLGQRQAMLVVAFIAKVTGVLLCIIGFFLSDSTTTAIIPIWVPLVLLGIFVFFSAKVEVDRYMDQQMEDMLDYDFSQGYTTFEQWSAEEEPPRPSLLSQWLEKRRKQRQRQKELLEEEEEWRMDDILSRVHKHGLKSLSAEDRAIMKRVSDRIRLRRDKMS